MVQSVGIFQHKQQHVPTPEEQALEAAQLAFGEDFRKELREKGRLKFDQIVGETATIFKNDLDATVTQVSRELKEHIVKQLDEQLVEYGRLMKDAQELALKSLNNSSQTLQGQHKELSETLKSNVIEQEEQLINVVKDTQTLAVESLNRSSKALDDKYYELTGLLSKNIGDQEKFLVDTFQENTTRIKEITDAQTVAVQMLQQSTKAVEQQYQMLTTTLKNNVENEQKMLVDGFQDNMAHIIEHYLLDALGEQYDLKAQLPAIIQQMESNKQTIVDDMKL